MEWTIEAQKELEKVPSFVRRMAKTAVEKLAKEKGLSKITPELVAETKAQYFSLDKPRQEGEKKPINVAVVRCHTVAEVCPGVGCLKAWNNRKVKFADYDQDAQLIGFFTCGGCSGRRVSRLVESLKKSDIDVIHLSSCMLMDGDFPKCPFKNQIKQTILNKAVKVVEGTHH